MLQLARFRKKSVQLINSNKVFLTFLLLMFVFRSAAADWNEVPTGSMKPTILEGDRIFVNKMAYDIRVPFTHISLFKRADPTAGEIIVFDSEVSQKRLVKRVVGEPGDIVEISNNVLIINGKPLAYQKANTHRFTEAHSEDYVEDLLGVTHFVRFQKGFQLAPDFGPVRVPEGHFLALGDNRDNSVDSRMIGFVPRHEIVGKANHVVLSFDYENHYIPRKNRFWVPI